LVTCLFHSGRSQKLYANERKSVRMLPAHAHTKGRCGESAKTTSRR